MSGATPPPRAGLAAREVLRRSAGGSVRRQALEEPEPFGNRNAGFAVFFLRRLDFELRELIARRSISLSAPRRAGRLE